MSLIQPPLPSLIQSRETDLLIITFSPESDKFEHWIKVVRKIRSHLTQKFWNCSSLCHSLRKEFSS
jgi:hypothetical protein